MADHDVLFFGSLVVTLTEVQVHRDALPKNVQKSSPAKLRVKVTVMPVDGTSVEERLGECISSAEYPLQSAELDEDLFIPVMLERSRFLAAPLGAANKPGNPANGKDTLATTLLLDISVTHDGTSWAVVRRSLVMESLNDVCLQNCGVATAFVASTTLCVSELHGNGLAVPDQGENLSITGSDVRCNNIEWSDMELSFTVRALDMSMPIHAMLKAESDARNMFRLRQDHPCMSFVFPPQKTPYGALPLDVMYEFYVSFCEQLLNKTLKPSEHFLKILRGAKSATTSDSKNISSGVWRWSALSVVDLRPVLLGNDALIPVLATLFHCPSLCSLLLDQNSLGDMTCFRLAALFHRHRHLHELSMCRNEVYESGAEQLLRLVRRNTQIVHLHVMGNHCSASVLNRIERVTKLNCEALENDPFNVFSSSYAYATSLVSIPTPVVKKALAVWAMLSTAPLGPIESAVNTAPVGAAAAAHIANKAKIRNKIRGVDDSVEMGEEEDDGKRYLSIIPRCALAPLLNEIARTVALRLSSVVEDPCIRMVFADIESHWSAAAAAAPLDRKKDLDLQVGVVEKKGKEEYDGETKVIEEQKGMGVESAAPLLLGQQWVSLVDLEELYRFSFLHIVVVTMRSLACKADWAESVTVLRDIGRHQKAMGVMPADYRDALQAFVKSINHVSGMDNVNAENSVAFLQCLAVGVRVALGL